MSQDATQTDGSGGESWIVSRPAEVLLQLPVPFRWEFTRRHPYYLLNWQAAHQDRTELSSDRLQRAREKMASLILTTIGVPIDPPPPSTSAVALEMPSLKKAWVDGAVAPVTYRGYVVMLLAGLPPDLLRILGTTLTACANSDDDPDSGKYRLIDNLMHHPHAALDAVPMGPVIGVNLYAPSSTILDAIEGLVKEWKADAHIPELRRRDDKLEDYLAVWDLREGWVNDHYEPHAERTFKQIAVQLSTPISTVGNRYRSAFHFIVGHDFTPELWVRVFGLFKIASWLDLEKLPIRPLRRRWRTPSPRPVPETTLQSSVRAATSGSFLDTFEAPGTELTLYEDMLDARELMEKGFTDDQISSKLDLQSPEGYELIKYVRARYDDSL